MFSSTSTVYYEIFVQSFADSNGDGIGDLKGLQNKLDYLQNLGIEAIWLMPIHPSPSYHKYDVTNYYDIHPSYGTLNDFHKLVSEIHQRGLKIIIDFVVNHTSDEHPWFLEAQKGKNNPYRYYYIWIEDKEILDNDPPFHWHSLKNEEGDLLAGEKYYGVFWHKMPDLNLSNPLVQNEIIKIARFWLEEMQVDGFRVDAAKFAIREDQPKENHKWWRYFAEEVRKIKPDVYLVGEVWDGPEIIAPYLHKGFDACFNFRLGDLILKTVNARKDHYQLIQAYTEIIELYKAHNNDFSDATFITNHDLDRVGSVVKQSTNGMKMAASLLFTLPGTPYIYYGEELGMLGKKPDEYIREPFLWDRHKISDQTTWKQPKYSTLENVIPLNEQIKSPHSLYHHYRKWIHFRKINEALKLGEMMPCIEINVSGLLAFFRITKNERLLIIHNLGGRRKRCILPEKFTTFVFATRKAVFIDVSTIELASFSTVILAQHV